MCNLISDNKVGTGMIFIVCTYQKLYNMSQCKINLIQKNYPVFICLIDIRRSSFEVNKTSLFLSDFEKVFSFHYNFLWFKLLKMPPILLYCVRSSLTVQSVWDLRILKSFLGTIINFLCLTFPYYVFLLLIICGKKSRLM